MRLDLVLASLCDEKIRSIHDTFKLLVHSGALLAMRGNNVCITLVPYGIMWEVVHA